MIFPSRRCIRHRKWFFRNNSRLFQRIQNPLIYVQTREENATYHS